MHMVDDGAAVAFGVAFPDVWFLLAAFGVIELHTAFTIAKWSGLALIGCYGYWAAQLAGRPCLAHSSGVASSRWSGAP